MNKSNDSLLELKKYLAYFFETNGFTGLATAEAEHQMHLDLAQAIRGPGRGPAIMVHGIMPRSGTVYVGELLRLHPGLHAYPHGLWELPALPLIPELRDLQEKFLFSYRLNRGKLDPDIFLTLFGSAIMAYLHAPAPVDKRILVKMPSVQYLNEFFTMFPIENLMILIRDGRDLVHSTLRTWPKLNFIQVCLRWNRSAQAVIDVSSALAQRGKEGFWLGKYEDALKDPESFVRAACENFKLDPGCFPYEQIEKIRVIGSSKLEHEKSVKWRHLEKPADFSPTEYWQKWSNIKKSIFKWIAGKSLVKLGYSKDLNW